MTNLKFIEKEIEIIQELLNDKNSPFRNDNSYWNNKLNHLQQIKTILEAWEVIKYSIYKRKMGGEHYIQVIGGVYNEEEYWTSGINPYEILKEALEVKDE